MEPAGKRKPEFKEDTTVKVARNLGVTYNEAVNVVYPQFFKVNSTHDRDDKLELSIYSGCHKEETTGVIGHHNGLDFSKTNQGHILNFGERLSKFTALAELCILHHNDDMDKLDPLVLHDLNRVKKFRKRLIIRILSMIFHGRRDFENNKFWANVIIMMELTNDPNTNWIQRSDDDTNGNMINVKNASRLSFYQFYETREDIENWSKMMAELFKTENESLHDILKFLSVNLKKSSDDLFKELEGLLMNPTPKEQTPPNPNPPTNPLISKRRLSAVTTDQTTKRTRTTTTEKPTSPPGSPMSIEPSPAMSGECSISPCPRRSARNVKATTSQEAASCPMPPSKRSSERIRKNLATPSVEKHQRRSGRIPPKSPGDASTPPPIRTSGTKTTPRAEIQMESESESDDEDGEKVIADPIEKLKKTKISLTTSRPLSDQDINFIYTLAKSMNKDSIEDEIVEFENDQSSLSFFLIQMLSGKNIMNWTADDAKELLEEFIKFALKGEKGVELRRGGKIYGQRIVEWEHLMKKDDEDARTNLHTSWRDVFYKERGRFWKTKSDVLDFISIYMYDSFNVTERSKRSGIKNTGVNPRKINFVLRGVVECLYLTLEQECPVDVNDEIYVEWKEKFNFTAKKLKLPTELVTLVPGAEVDPNWDDTLKFLREHRQVYKYNFDKKNTKNRTEKSYFNILWNDAEVVAKYWMDNKNDGCSSGEEGDGDQI